MVPLSLIKFGAIVIDNATDSGTFSKVKQFLKYFKLWITIRSEGAPLKFTTFGVLNNYIDNESCFIHAFDQMQVVPLLWTHILKNDHILNVPKSILKKTTLIDCSVKLKPEETSVFLKFCDIRTSVSGLPRKVELSTRALLDYPIDNVHGCLLSVLLQRTKPMNKQFALESLQKHFEVNLKGTIAQRISKSESDLLNLPQLSENGSFPDASFVIRNFNELDQCQICFSEPANLVTLCGHGYCKDCSDMLKKDKVVSLCPICRSSLCDYDWIQLNDSKTEAYKITKVLKIEETLKKAMVKRSKKRLHETIYIVSELIDNIFYLNNFEDNVFVVTFEDLKNQSFGTYATIIFACPPPNEDINYALIKLANQGDISIQIHLIYVEGYEEVQASATKELFLCEPRKKPKIIL